MSLLDANLGIRFAGLLRSLQIDWDTAGNRGWKALRNGDLVSAAVNAGFDTLLTRDQLFAQAASRVWRKFPDFTIIAIMLPQLPSKRYLEVFANAWVLAPLKPQRGKTLIWP